MAELKLIRRPLAPFRRGDLMFYRQPMPNGIAWVGGNARGCIVFQVWRMPDKVSDLYGMQKIGGKWWMGTDVGRHTARPVAEWDTKAHDGCEYLDGMPCYYDGSSLQALELLQRAVSAGSEDAIWAELAGYFRAWIARESA